MNRKANGHKSQVQVQPFGMRAVQMQFITLEQVEKALAVQTMLDKNGQHQSLGMIMIDLEMLTTTQMLAVLKTYQAK